MKRTKKAIAASILAGLTIVAAGCPGSGIGAANSGTLAWQGTQLFGAGSGAVTDGTSIASDSSGLYVTGYTTGNLNGNTLIGNQDGFVTKYDYFGVAQWTQTFGAAGAWDVTPAGAVTDSTGVYIAGHTSAGLDGNTLIGTDDFFLAKYSTSGALQWLKELGGSGANASTTAVALDSTGIYAVGQTSAAFDGNAFVGGAGKVDGFIVKYDSSGNKSWSEEIGVSGARVVFNGVATDSTGVYVTGSANSNFDGHTLTGTFDLILIKYDSSGTEQWSVELGGPGVTIAAAVTAPDSTSVYVVGQTTGGMDGNPTTGGVDDLFVAKFDASTGSMQWVKQLAGADVSGANAVSSDGTSIYVSGLTLAGLDGNSLIGSQDAVIAKYDSSGSLLWVNETGVAGASSQVNASCMSSGALYITGNSTGNFNGKPLIGYEDAFLSKLSASGSML